MDSTKTINSSRGAYRLEITFPIEFRGPLHSGTGERLSVTTDAPVLRFPGGEPALTGSSVRGVIRDWCEREAPVRGVSPETVSRLFGVTPEKHATASGADTDRQGRLTVHDAVLRGVAMTNPAHRHIPSEIRDHVRIDHRHGAAARGAKFDQEVIHCEGADLRLVYEGDGPEDEEIDLLHAAVDALRHGLLAFGGKTGWGYGWVRPRADDKPWPIASVHNRSNAKGLHAYLDERRSGAKSATSDLPPTREKKPRKREKSEPQPWSWLHLDLQLQFDGPMLIAGPDRRPDGKDAKLPDDIYFAAITNPETPVLPGSSFRGVLRSHAERIVNGLDARPTTSPQHESFSGIAQRLFGFADDQSNTGSQGLLRVGDGVIADGASVHTVWMDHVAIDRITGFAAKGKLFNALALASPRFEVPLMLRWHDDDVDRAAAALLLFALRDAAQGILWIGSRTTRGYGHLADLEIRATRCSLVSSDGTRSEARHIAASTITKLGEDEGIKELVASWSKRLLMAK